MTARFESRPNTFYHSYTTPLSLPHAQGVTQSQAQSQIQIQYYDPSQPCTSTQHLIHPTPLPLPFSRPNKQRPKSLKKASSMKTKTRTNQNQEMVQQSLEHKVERAKGFHAFFVPLARGLPPAPPSSPVMRGRGVVGGGGMGEGIEGLEGFQLDGGSGRSGDYFGPCWNGQGVKGGKTRDMWVEDVGEEESSGMDLDSE